MAETSTMLPRSECPGSRAAPGTNLRTGTSRFTWLVALTCLAAWMVFMPFTLQHESHYEWDSAAYVEGTQSLVAGRGLEHRTIFGVDPPVWQPIRRWPPGYALLIAPLHAVGLSAPTAGIVVSLVSGGIFVLILARVCLWLFPPAVALPVALAGVCMLSFLQVSTNCLSDAPYASLAAGSLACLIRWTRQEAAPPRWLLAAGFLAGAALAVRYVGFSLLATSAIFLLVSGRCLSVGRAYRVIGPWLLGVSLCTVPLFLHNLATTGELIPHSWPPSNLSTWDNLREIALVIVRDLTTSRLLSTLIVDKYVLAPVLLLLIVGTWVLSRRLSASRLRDFVWRNQQVLLLIGYAGLNLAVIVAARVNYLGQVNYSRLFIQVYWIGWIAAATVAMEVCRAAGFRSWGRQAVLGGIFTIIALLQVHSTLSKLSTPPNTFDSLQVWLGEEAGQYLAASVPDHQIVLSCRADLLRIHYGINARAIIPSGYDEYPELRSPSRDEMNRAGRSGFLWGVVIADVKGAKKGVYSNWVQELALRPEAFPELERVPVSGPALIFRYVGLSQR